MSTIRLLAAAAACALLAGPAFAGPATPMHPPAMNTPMTDPLTTPPETAEEAGLPASTIVSDETVPAVIPLSSPTPAEQAWTLKAGDPTVVTNGPVPDTAENRAKYGQPLSATGKRTTPAGN
jgi:hypothetical protein